MLYGFGKLFCSSFREIGLAPRCRSFLVWVCLVLAFSPSVSFSFRDFPWVEGAGNVIFKTGRPQRYYTEREILLAWRPYLPSAMPSPSSISDVYVWLEDNGYYNQITPPTVCAITNTEREVDFGEFYVGSSNSLVSVAIAPSVGLNPEGDETAYLFPAYLSSRYGLGFFGPDSLDPFGSSPAFGGNLSWGGGLGIFTTNLFTTDPWKFSDYEANTPLVYPSQDMTGQDFFLRSRAFFKGRLRVMNVYYIFPLAPNMGRVESTSGYPVTRLSAFSMLDEYWLPWYWQTASGVVVWEDGDTIKIRNVLRFSSPTNSTDGAR